MFKCTVGHVVSSDSFYGSVAIDNLDVKMTCCSGLTLTMLISFLCLSSSLLLLYID